MSRRRFHPPERLKLEDKTAERVRHSHDEAIRELQDVPLLGGKLIENVEIPDATSVPVFHGLGRLPRVFVSPPRFKSTPTVGVIRDRSRLTTVTPKYDPTQYVVLHGQGFGVSAYVDVWVF